ncbi:hypothetical protein [Lacticaseibacillus saniviri]|uniref:Uncharacterized protein n=1 Tax=Lacticaseibacillus saniviri JCM 17471 = DSM 24301 TaxID=1293598 RepID=A0A0R2MX41_9LACO|nr:hypothetical protein [Lacticaseibacillus saniviri]KRO16163.1 hypothetical protein IV56_GL001919 [Lacticaseibacillus saniviri JCM 17471 = DSM 24301]
MKQRCLNPNNHKYPRYGGRGIKICDEWLNDFYAFNSWALSHGYKKGLSIDRIKVNGDYGPDNCRWVSQKVQQNNRENNYRLTVDGQTRTLAEWAMKSRFTASAIRARIEIQGRSAYDAVYGDNPRLIFITIDGQTKTATEWNKIKGYRSGLVLSRIERGWNPIQAVQTSPRKGNYRHG